MPMTGENGKCPFAAVGAAIGRPCGIMSVSTLVFGEFVKSTVRTSNARPYRGIRKFLVMVRRAGHRREPDSSDALP